jgi:hypothetical protein
MNDVGVLTKRGLRDLHEIYDLWEKQLKVKRAGKKLHVQILNTLLMVSNILIPYLPSVRSPPTSVKSQPEKSLELRCEELKNLIWKDVRVQVCAVWDTVGALGIPMPWFLPQLPSKKLAFIDTKVCGNIDNAIQALALNERRRAFQPTMWQIPERPNDPRQPRQTLKQCWFLGCHSDVGGGVASTSLSNIALVWMISQLKDFLTFDTRALWDFTASERQKKSWTVQYEMYFLPLLGSSIGYSLTFEKFAASGTVTLSERSNTMLSPCSK